MIGADTVPLRLGLNVPVYVPTRTQMVSPGWTLPPAPLKAVDRFHGLPVVPESPLVPPVVTYQPVCVPGGGGGGGGPVGFSVHAPTTPATTITAQMLRFTFPPDMGATSVMAPLWRRRGSAEADFLHPKGVAWVPQAPP